jgi:hypothetical protein
VPARTREWTRVPHLSFPRNEGAPGSSPGVGLKNTCKSASSVVSIEDSGEYAGTSAFWALASPYNAATPLTRSQTPKPRPRATWIHRLFLVIHDPTQGRRRDEALGTTTASTSGSHATIRVMTRMISAAIPCCRSGRPLPAISASAGM